MFSFEWSITYEDFVDGPGRWYAVRPDQPIPLVAESHERLVEKIWAFDFATWMAR
jgi:hypothetical protein